MRSPRLVPMMTDVARKFPGPAAALLAAGVVSMALTGCRFTAVKDAPVSLAAVRDAVVVSSSGERPAVEGARLAKGDRVRTAPDGTATLVVRDRRIVLGAATDVTVVDGATVGLAKGALLVDRRRGPSVTVHAGDTTVDRVGQGAVRVQRSFSVLVAGLSAGARVRTATGPSAALHVLHQIGVAGRALPRDDSPLHLRDDAWEKQVIGDVVDDDVRLNDLAHGIAGGETLLAEAIGRAAGRDDAARRQATRTARGLRAAGGSWGVVARLVRTSVVDDGSALADVIHGVPTTGPSTGPTGGPVVAGRTPTPGVGGTRGPTPTTTPTPKPTKPTGSKSEEPSSPPSTSPGVVEQLQSALPTPPILPVG
jgi:hypothetical protein